MSLHTVTLLYHLCIDPSRSTRSSAAGELHARYAREGGGGGGNLLPFVCEGTVAASDRTPAHPVQRDVPLSNGPRVPRPVMLHNHIRAKAPQEKISLSVSLSIRLSNGNNVRKHLNAILTAGQLVKTQMCAH